MYNLLLHPENVPLPSNQDTVTVSNSPVRDPSLGIDRKLMISRSRKTSIDKTMPKQTEDTKSTTSTTYFKNYQFATDDEVLENLPPCDRQMYSASVNTIRTFASKFSDASFSTNKYQADFEESEESSEDDDGNWGITISGRKSDSDPLPNPENESGRGAESLLYKVLNKKFEELGSLLSKVPISKRNELTKEIFQSFDCVLKRYDGGGNAMQFLENSLNSITTPMEENIIPSTKRIMKDDHNVVHNGYLSKRGTWVPQYRQRFVVLLKSGHLRYYMDASCIQLRGEINFLKCLRVDFEGKYFSIHGKDNVWRFFCPVESKLNRWKEAFQHSFKLSKTACIKHLFEGMIMKKDGFWGSWRKRFMTLNDRGKVRIFRNEKACFVDESMRAKELIWESYDTNWETYPFGVRTVVNDRPLSFAFSQIDQRRSFRRGLSRGHETGSYKHSIPSLAHW